MYLQNSGVYISLYHYYTLHFHSSSVSYTIYYVLCPFGLFGTCATLVTFVTFVRLDFLAVGL